jgi:hypothetical protein
MNGTAKRWVALSALVTVLSILISCSSGPAGPQMGTPAFYWQAAREVYATGDYTKTLEHLDELLATNNEYLDRALPWDLVLKSGLAAGYVDLAENYAVGARMNRSDPTAFRRVASESRNMAARLSLQFADGFAKFDNVKGDTVSLAFVLPRGSAAPVAQFSKVASGVPLAAAEADTVQKRALERGVVLAACKAAGASGDVAKAGELLKGGTATVSRATFLMAMAETLYSQSQLFTPDKLDQPEKLRIFCERAQTALKGVPESKESKDLNGRIQAALKKVKK